MDAGLEPLHAETPNILTGAHDPRAAAARLRVPGGCDTGERGVRKVCQGPGVPRAH